MQWDTLLSQYLRFSNTYAQNAKTEHLLGEQIIQLTQDYHVVSKYVHQLRSWLQVFTHNNDDVGSISQTTWKAVEDKISHLAKSLNKGEPFDPTLQACTKFVSFLRQNPHEVALMLVAAHERDCSRVDSHRDVAEIVLFSLFNNIFEKREITFCRIVITEVLRMEIRNCMAPTYSARDFLSSEDPVPMTIVLLRSLMRRFMPFVANVFGSIVQSVYNEKHTNIDIPDEHPGLDTRRRSGWSLAAQGTPNSSDKVSLFKSPKKTTLKIGGFKFLSKRAKKGPRSDVGFASADPGNPEQALHPKSYPATMQSRISNLIRYVGYFLDTVISTMTQWPWAVKAAVSDVLNFSKTQWPDTWKDDKIAIIGIVMYDFLVIPALERPYLFGVHAEFPPSGRIRRNLEVIALMLRQLIVLARPFGSGHHFERLNDFVAANMPRVQDKLSQLADALLAMPSLKQSKALYLPSSSSSPAPSPSSSPTAPQRSIIPSATSSFLCSSHPPPGSKSPTSPPPRPLALSPPPRAPRPSSHDPAQPILPEEIIYFPVVAMEVSQVHHLHSLMFSKPKLARAHASGQPEIMHKTTKVVELSKFQSLCFKDQARYFLLDTRVKLDIPEGESAVPSAVPFDESARVVTPFLPRLKAVLKTRVMPETERDAAMMLAKVFLDTDPDLLCGFRTGGTLQALVEHLRGEAEGLLERDWENFSTILSVLDELLRWMSSCSSSVLSVDLAVDLDKLGSHLQWGLESIQNAHAHEFLARVARLQTGVGQATQSVRLVKKEFDFINTVVFRLKFRIWCADEYIPFEVQLPEAAGEQASRKGSMTSPQARHPKDKHHVPVFRTDTVQLFVSEFKHHDALLNDKTLAAEVYHLFFEEARKVVKEDQDFSQTLLLSSKDLTTMAISDLAMKELEEHLGMHLYKVFFSEGSSPDSADDLSLVSLLTALQWVAPQHVYIADQPKDLEAWRRPIQELQRLDVERSPSGKLACLVTTIKWIAKMVGAKGSVDADTALSALIYVIIHASPPRLCSNLEYIQLLGRPEQLTMGEGSYALMQFDAASHHISYSLAGVNQEQHEAHQAKEAKEMEKRSGKTSLSSSSSNSLASRRTPDDDGRRRSRYSRTSRVRLTTVVGVRPPAKTVMWGSATMTVLAPRVTINWASALVPALMNRVLSHLPPVNYALVCKKWMHMAIRNEESQHLKQLPSNPSEAVKFLRESL